MTVTRLVVIVATVAIAVRLVFILFFPFTGGDWPIYSTVAENILRGCGVSLSRIGSGECVAHFGGNHLPGYPAFVAAIWAFSAHSDMAVRVAQTLVYATALARLAVVVRRATGSDAAGLVVGLLMALSPLQLAWPRYTQTETLSLAAVIWLFSELLASYAERRFRSLPIALAVAGATFIRLDGILLCVPVAVAGFLLHPPLEAVRRGAVAAVIVVLPLLAWTTRNVAVGISFWPQPMVLPNNGPAPYGYLQWGSTWVSEEYQRMGWAWPVTRFQYDGISIDDKAFDSAAEKERVQALLKELATYTGKPFPANIDAKFAELAQEREARAPWRTYVMLPAERALALWKNPLSSFGWPVELPSLGNQDRLTAARSEGYLLGLAKKYPAQAAIKALIAGYRFALLGAFVVALVFSFVGRLNAGNFALWTAASWIVARTAFFAITNNVETRYTAPTTPAVELAVVLAVLVALGRRRWFGLGHIGLGAKEPSAS